MNLHNHYERLWKDSLEKFKDYQFQYDHLIDSAADTRRGITLLVRPSDEVKSNIKHFLAELMTALPGQYYYPDSDIHMTVMSIISCYAGFGLKQIKSSDYINIISDCLADIGELQIKFKGITASASSIMVRGFPDNDHLTKLRNRLRDSFKHSDLEQSLDKRYKIQTAHLTIARFKNEVENVDSLLDILHKYGQFDFGYTPATEYELVFNDWYQRKDNTVILSSFKA